MLMNIFKRIKYEMAYKKCFKLGQHYLKEARKEINNGELWSMYSVLASSYLSKACKIKSEMNQ